MFLPRAIIAPDFNHQTIGNSLEDKAKVQPKGSTWPQERNASCCPRLRDKEKQNENNLYVLLVFVGFWGLLED